MREMLSPKQVAMAIGVSEASLKRWCDRGLIPFQRTPGGHRRLPLEGVLAYLRKSQTGLAHPEVLGLPSVTGTGARTWERGVGQLLRGLVEGDGEQVRRTVIDFFMGGRSLCEIVDRMMAEAFHRLGEKWQHGEIEVYQERLACELCRSVLHELGNTLGAPSSSAPLAIGATLENDHYMLPTLMAELVMREAGWRAESLGCGHPVSTLRAAVEKRRPRLMWLSVSFADSPTELIHRVNELYAFCSSTGTALIVGGRAFTDDVRRETRFSAYGDTMRHLVDFASTLHAPAPEAIISSGSA